MCVAASTGLTQCAGARLTDSDSWLVLVCEQERDCTLCRECIREPTMAKKLRLARKKDHFIFAVESTGIVPPADLFKQAVQILRGKAQKMLDLVEQLEGELAVQAMEEDGADDDIES